MVNRWEYDVPSRSITSESFLAIIFLIFCATDLVNLDKNLWKEYQLHSRLFT